LRRKRRAIDESEDVPPAERLRTAAVERRQVLTRDRPTEDAGGAGFDQILRLDGKLHQRRRTRRNTAEQIPRSFVVFVRLQVDAPAPTGFRAGRVAERPGGAPSER